MSEADIKQTYLNQTINCDACLGTGKIKNEAGEDIECNICGGRGIVVDSVIPNIVKKYVPEIRRIEIPRMMIEIFDHIGSKLKDSYDRGYFDGKADQEVKS